MRSLWSLYKIGFLSLVPLLVLVVICLSFFGLLWGWTGEFSSWVSGGLISRFLFMAIFLALPLLMGFIVSWKRFREIILKLFSKVPVVSLVVDLFFNSVNVEKAKEGGFLQEVIFKTDEHTALFGTVTNEFQAPSGLASGQLVDWLVIIIPTTPISVTGPVVLRKKTSVVYTGRFIKDTSISVASFCSKFNIDYRQFSQGSPR